MTLTVFGVEADPIEGGSSNDYDYVGQGPVNSVDLDGMCKTHEGLFGHIRDAGCHTGNDARGVARTVGRCAYYFDACSTNIKIALSPVLAAGMTFHVGATYVGICVTTAIGCVVGIPLAVATVVGGYVTYRLARKVWFGPGRNKIYKPLGPERA